MCDRGFTIEATLDAGQGLGRAGCIHTAHGDIHTPIFVPVGTKATVKTVLPDMMRDLGAEALLANAYHLYLRPGADIVDEAGGVSRFMNWNGPTFTDSGGFQVMSLGTGFSKVLSQEFAGIAPHEQYVAEGHERLAYVDDDGVSFKSHLDGSKHRFSPEISMRVQHQLGADIMFAFDELTTLLDPRSYQITALERTHAWALRCLEAHRLLTEERADKPYQMLFGVVQGAQYEDLRRKAARDLAEMQSNAQRFDGFGIGGALQKENLAEIVGWACEELPLDRPRHLLGLSDPEDIFAGVESGIDTFDCVDPSRRARNGCIFTPYGNMSIRKACYKRDFVPLVEGCGCYTCQNFTRAYVHHLFRAKELLAFTLATIHNEYTIVQLTRKIRQAIFDGDYAELKEETLGRLRGIHT